MGLVASTSPTAARAEPPTSSQESAASTSVARGAADAPVAFGPFDAGASRGVRRQGAVGRRRPAHPVVGAPAHVPGNGPPPPPLPRPIDIPELALEQPNALRGSGLSSSPLWLAALTYQHLLTRLDGPRCQHLPTCSRFAAQAVARHGLVGFWMGLDRLIQPTESSAIRRLPEVEGWGGLRGFDPVENYEFWVAERFSGLPAPVPEEPLELAPLRAPLATAPAASEAPAL